MFRFCEHVHNRIYIKSFDGWGDWLSAIYVVNVAFIHNASKDSLSYALSSM